MAMYNGILLLSTPKIVSSYCMAQVDSNKSSETLANS